MIIDWKEYVDKIYVMDYVGHKCKKQKLMDELHRVDMSDSMIVDFENIDTKLFDTLKALYTDKSPDKTLFTYTFNVTIGHYFCMRHALQAGYDRVLILENDACFLKDKDKVKETLDKSIKCFDEGADILLGSTSVVSVKYDENNNKQYIQHNLYNEWHDTEIGYGKMTGDEEITGGAAFNIYNRKAMEYFCNYIESLQFATVDYYNIIYDSSINKYYMINQICVQQHWCIFEDTRNYNLEKPTLDFILNSPVWTDNGGVQINRNTGHYMIYDNIAYYDLIQDLLDKYVDNIYIISYVKNENERTRITKELHNLGITKFEFVYIYDFVENVNEYFNLSPKHFSISFAHYNVMKTAKELDKQRILVFEDDVHFLKDKYDFVNMFLEGIIQDADITLYDYMYTYYNADEINYHDYAIQLQSGYMVNQKGMDFYITNWEKNHWIIDQYLYQHDGIFYADPIRTTGYNNNERYYCIDPTTYDTSIFCTPLRLCYQPGVYNNVFTAKHLIYDIPTEKYQ